MKRFLQCQLDDGGARTLLNPEHIVSVTPRAVGLGTQIVAGTTVVLVKESVEEIVEKLYEIEKEIS